MQIVLKAVLTEDTYFDLDFRLIVPSPIEAHRLVNQQRVIHRHDEELLRGRETLAFGRPDVQGDPGLRQQPQQPHPGILLRHEVIEEVRQRRLVKQIIRYGAVKEARIIVAETARGDQQRDRHRYREIHRERVAEALNQDLARELACE